MARSAEVASAYESARDRYAGWGVDTEKALEILGGISLSLHCWQGDDVGGFERPDSALSGGGIQVTGNRPGKARNPEELKADLKQALSLIPGNHRLNLHAMYGEFGGASVDRDAIRPGHFQGWVDWAGQEKLKLDFNATCFSHPKAKDGFTLSHPDKGIRNFWIAHVKQCREISAFMGRELGSPCIHNLWIPDGSKDLPADRFLHRRLLKEALDEIFTLDYPSIEMKDALESKLFGLGSESYVVGSHEFYMGYALANKKMLCLDAGHFHPTESVADKISAVMQFSDELLLHVSRGVRWDSDHVVILDDATRQLAEEMVRSDALDRIHIALDFFDASMNRVGAWVIGARAVEKALLMALLEPRDRLRAYEAEGDFFGRLALMESFKTMPYPAVWDYYCLQKDVPLKEGWIKAVQKYEKEITRHREG